MDPIPNISYAQLYGGTVETFRPTHPGQPLQLTCSVAGGSWDRGVPVQHLRHMPCSVGESNCDGDTYWDPLLSCSVLLDIAEL